MLGFIETRILCQGVRFPFPAPLMQQGQGGLRGLKEMLREVCSKFKEAKNLLVVRVSRGSTGHFLLEGHSAGGGGGGWSN